MEPQAVDRAVAAASLLATDLRLTVDHAFVIQNSNKLTLRLLPCDVLARVAVVGQEAAALELEIAERLAATHHAARPDARVPARVYQRDGFAVTFWTYYEPSADRLPPAEYADALQRLHAGMRNAESATPHFTQRVKEAQDLIANRQATPALAESDRDLLMHTLHSARWAITNSGATEQILHGEPHAGNVLHTRDGAVFIDFETVCRGPLEFDVAHVPNDVSNLYPDMHQDLLQECRRLVLALIAAWRWDVRDQFPDGPRLGRHILAVLGRGAPWPTLDDLDILNVRSAPISDH